jgi:membrane-bound metal-dependent hydrolase YbcI (DUF457 family)
MYFFFHLITGVIIGFLLGDILRDQRWVIPCGLGAVLPDVIDKPVGYLLSQVIISDGRAWFHGLGILVVVLVMGMLVWKRWRAPAFLAISLGILSHQILDVMWREPVVWFYPFLGPYRKRFPLEYLFQLLSAELANPAEWILVFFLVIGVVAYWRRDRLVLLAGKHRSISLYLLSLSTFLLGMLAVVIFLFYFWKISLPAFGWDRREEYLIGGGVTILGAYLVWRWRTALGNLPVAENQE